MIPASQQPTILVVDDDPLTLAILDIILPPLGCNLLKAESGEDALVLLESESEIDLILLDYMMPRMNGIETLQLIRQRFPLRRIPVIMITSDHENLVLSMKMGADDFISKPLNPEEIRLRVKKLLQSKWEAESADRTKQEFLNNMSHEIRTPMNGILGMAQLLALTDLSDEQAEYLNALEISAPRLMELLNNILIVARLDSERMFVSPSSFDLKKSISEVLGCMSLRFSQKNLKVLVQIADDIPDQIVADNILLTQILGQVIGNAIKFTEQGGICIRAQGDERHENAVMIHIEVEDTGIGIPPEDIDRIFDTFTQLDGSFKRRFEGAGLGLSACRKLIELLGGSISLESRPGTGTTVHLFFPAFIPSEQHDDIPKSAAIPGKESLQILLAEDNHISSMFAERLLMDGGHHVTVAADGKEAFELCQNSRFDLVLMDIEMPILSGTEVMEKIRQHEKITGAHMPIIAVTAYGMKGDRERFLGQGFDGYVSKPFRIATLLDEISQVTG